MAGWLDSDTMQVLLGRTILAVIQVTEGETEVVNLRESDERLGFLVNVGSAWPRSWPR